MELASLILRTFPRDLSRMQRSVLSVPGVEIHHVDSAGKLVIVVETDTHADLTRAVSRLESIDGLLSMSMVFQYSDEAQMEIET